jgi:hypothetical protein
MHDAGGPHVGLEMRRREIQIAPHVVVHTSGLRGQHLLRLAMDLQASE